MTDWYNHEEAKTNYGLRYIPADVFSSIAPRGERKGWRRRWLTDQTDDGYQVFVGVIVTYPPPQVYYSRLTAMRKDWCESRRVKYMEDNGDVHNVQTGAANERYLV